MPLPNLLNGAAAQALPAGSSAQDVLAWMQQKFGVVKYSSQQMTRYPYYFYTAYPAAGASEIGFFSQNSVQVGTQLTNIENAGTIGNYSYLLTSISFDILPYIPTIANNQPSSYTTDALAPYADIVHGLTQGGTFEFRVANTLWDQIPLPFMFSPPADGRPTTSIAQGGFSWTQAGGSPFAVTGSQASLCSADLERRAWRRRNFVNPIFIAPQQTFTAKIFYPSGLIPVIATSVINNTTSFLYVGCRFDGWRFAPVS
jgi:hypothetical protein